MAGAGLVAQGLKEALVETLTGILCPVQGVRAAAEEQVKVLEVTEEFGVHLAELTVDPQGVLAIRQAFHILEDITILMVPYWLTKLLEGNLQCMQLKYLNI